jgi:hypothetical protein
VGPGECGRDFDYLLCREKPHHFVGGTVRTKDWLRENFKQEDQEFVRAEYETLAKLGWLINRVLRQNGTRAIVAMLFARYYNFDLDAPFMPQFHSNMRQLEELLTQLI